MNIDSDYYMTTWVGIRREDKLEEERTPLIPEHIETLIKKQGLCFIVQPSKQRIFKDEEYIKIGAKVQEDLARCNLILGVKEIPPKSLLPKKTYMFFSHTIKGQSYNMPMLKRLLELKCQLIDYEKITDKKGRRLIFFGNHAGRAGMIDTLWALGKRLETEGISNPFSQIKRAYEYKEFKYIKEHLTEIGRIIKTKGLDKRITPLICGITGYGNVSQGAQKVLQLLPTKNITPQEVFSPLKDKKSIYQVIFKEEDLVEPVSNKFHFELYDYYAHPERYRSKFHIYLSHLSLLVNCIYWEPKYPRIVTKAKIKEIYKSQETKLKVIGDISCDLEGSIECTLETTSFKGPCYVYHPFNGSISKGYKGIGPVIVAIDNLPCALARESSKDFSEMVMRFIPEIASFDYSKEFGRCDLSLPIKNAIIVYQGELTPNYKYLAKYL